jgi:hypothetical protein
MASDERKIDPEVQEIIADEKRLVRGARKDAATTEKKRNRLARKALEAIQACDQRAFATHLRDAEIRDGSDEWKRAWKIFRQECGES